jgi:hypothetical protein
MCDVPSTAVCYKECIEFIFGIVYRLFGHLFTIQVALVITGMSKHIIFHITSILIPYKPPFHVRWVPCHHGMARPQVADEGKSSGYGG